ncbi:hypothetical protein PG988_010253 [Apiospora saccharicola]
MSPTQNLIKKMATMSLTDDFKTRHESKLRYRKDHMSSRPLPAMKQTNLPQIFLLSLFNYSSDSFNDSSAPFNRSSASFNHSSSPFERSSTSLNRSSTSIERSSTPFDRSWKRNLPTATQQCAMESEVGNEHIGSKVIFTQSLSFCYLCLVYMCADCQMCRTTRSVRMGT